MPTMQMHFAMHAYVIMLTSAKIAPTVTIHLSLIDYHDSRQT